MKHIIFFLTIWMSASVLALGGTPIKTDGTKYYLQVYDGKTNDKVVYFNFAEPSGYEKIRVADYFDGSGSQLWSFTPTAMYPGYFSINNHSPNITPAWSMMSWNWNAYLTLAANRDPKTDKEMQFRFVETFDGYYILETIVKPTDGSLYNIAYTPGADAFNITNGIASFRGVKSADITRENMVNKVFKVVEFNPMKLFQESILRGDQLYNSITNAPEKVRYDLFYTLEKAREIRVFGKDAEMLAYQKNIDAAMANFNSATGFVALIDGYRTYIATANVNQNIKNSFLAIVNKAQTFISSNNLNYSEITASTANLKGAKELIDAIITTQVYGQSLTGQDPRLNTGLTVSIANAEAVLTNSASGTNEFTAASTHMTATKSVIDQIIIANNLIKATQEFVEAKATLSAAVEKAITTINTSGTPSSAMDQAVLDTKNAITAFQKALEAGDTPLVLKNANFDGGIADWSWDTDAPSAVRPSVKGVGASKSMTLWNGTAYRMKFFQSITNIPDGKYILSAFISTNVEGAFKLFAESGATVSEKLVTLAGGVLEKRQIEITVEDGNLVFGVKGAGDNNGLAAGSWVVLDDFDLKWSSSLPVKNAMFNDGQLGWLWDTDAPSAIRPSVKGVDGSKSMTLWNGSAYKMKFYQTISDIPNGKYTLSAIGSTNIDRAYNLYATSGTNTVVSSITLGTGALEKRVLEVNVVDGKLEFGLKGAGENNSIAAGGWVIIDNVELKWSSQLSLANPLFEDGNAGWLWDTNTPSAVRPSAKGVGGSKSMTLWNGSAYTMKFYQSLSNLTNGTYELSAMIQTNIEGAYNIIAESGTNVQKSLVTLGNGALEKRKVELTVASGSANIGVAGAGENNGIAGGSWVVLDNFEFRLKSITPKYVVFVPSPEQMLVTDIDNLDMTNKIIYWQGNGKLNIKSNDVIVKYSVYSITGVVVESKEANSTNVSVPLKNGIYVVHVLTENGQVDTEKVIIR